MDTIGSKVTALQHFTIAVSDIDRAERFYTQVLGAEVVRRRNEGLPGYHISIVLGGSVRIDVFPMPQRVFCGPGESYHADGGHPHYAFSVGPDEMSEVVEILTAHRVGFDGPVRQGPPGTASIYLDDPDGNHLEIVTDHFPEEKLVRVGPPDREKLKYTWADSGSRAT